MSLTLLDVGYDRVPRFPIQMLGSAGYLAPVISGLERAFGPTILKKVMGSELTQLDAETVSNSVEDLETRIADVKGQGWYSLEDIGYLQKALEFEPSMSVEGMELWLALYRMNPPKLISQVTSPCMLLYGSFPRSDVKVQRRVQRNIKRCRILNPTVHYQAVPSGHYVHWSSAEVTKNIGVFVRQHDEKS